MKTTTAKEKNAIQQKSHATFFLRKCFANDLITPVHELLHTLGFVHEHTRPDRDNFVEVNIFFFFFLFLILILIFLGQHGEHQTWKGREL